MHYKFLHINWRKLPPNIIWTKNYNKRKRKQWYLKERDPVRSETVINNTTEQINTCSYLGCSIISHQNVKDITAKISTSFQIPGIIKRTLKSYKFQKHIWINIYIWHFGITYFITRMRDLGNWRTDYIQDNFRGNKILRRMTKYTWQDYKTNEDIWSELNINPVAKIRQNYRNKLIHVKQMDSDRLPHLIINYRPCGKRSQRRPLKILLAS